MASVLTNTGSGQKNLYMEYKVESNTKLKVKHVSENYKCNNPCHSESVKVYNRKTKLISSKHIPTKNNKEPPSTRYLIPEFNTVLLTCNIL